VKKIFPVLIIVAAVILIYAPATQDGFVWDDTALVLRDPLIRSWRLVPESFNHFLFLDATASDFYRPLQRLSYTIDYAAFAFHPGPYHFLSILWHTAAAVALLLFAEEFLLAFGLEGRTRRLIAFAAAIVWAIHPVQSAAVIYVSGRADPMSATFGFLGCYFILRYSRATGASKWTWLSAGGCTLLLSVLSKEIGLIFPAVLLLFFALRKNWIAVWKTAVTAAFVCAIYFSLRAGAEYFRPPESSSSAPPLVRPIIVTRAIAEYTGLILFPLNLHMDRDVETNPSGLDPTSLTRASWRELQTLLGIVLAALFFYWIWRARKRNAAVFTCLLFTLITYLPISGIIALNATVAEHWIYLPSSFLFLAAAIEIGTAVQNSTIKSRTKVAVLTVIAIWTLFLGARAFIRTFDWKDQRTFLESTIAHGGDSARMLINLGALELTEGKFDDAAVHLHAALQKRPDQPLAILNLGALALKQNDFKLGRELLTRATKMPLVDAEAYELLTILENRQNKKVDLMQMRLAARTGPPNWAIEKRYVQVLDESGARSAAINELLDCLRGQWYRAESWQLLSELEMKAGHPDQAANALAQARAYDVHLR
jgi:tetratricopeptide (TPR) repeat protein